MNNTPEQPTVINLHDDRECLDIKQCSHFPPIKEFMNNYDKIKHDDHNYHTKLLDHFHHLIQHHNGAAHYDWIYSNLQTNCNSKHCQHIRRHFRNRERPIVNKQDINLNEAICEKPKFKELYDSIHCHFKHQYDFCRFTPREIEEIEEIESDQDDQKQADTPNLQQIQSKKVQEILNKKTNDLQSIMESEEYNKDNRFSTEMNQTAISHNTTNDGTKITKYSCGLPFNYKYEHRNCKDKSLRHLTYADLYVNPKHGDLKEELLNNEHFAIIMECWKYGMDKVSELWNTHNVNKSRAKTEKYFVSYIKRQRHPVFFGYEDGHPLTKKHLFCLVIYCSQNTFQKRFSETFRALHPKDEVKDIVERHRNYAHFGRYLKESVEVFGTECSKGTVDRVYHGIDQKMIFNGLQDRVYGVMSTTYNERIARQFSNNKGMMVELVPSGELKYFLCDWLSPFTHEGELLFYGGFTFFNFMNIVETATGWNYKAYIASIRIIDTMANGMYFMYDPADKARIEQRGDLDASCLKDVSIDTKKLCLELIYHQMNKNGYQCEKYKQISDLAGYVEQLLNAVCLNRTRLYIFWPSMDEDKLDLCDLWWSGGGYIGYYFMSGLFCCDRYEGIKLRVYNGLFPNLGSVRLWALSTIADEFIDDIAEFVQNEQQSKLWHFELTIDPELKGANIWEQVGENKKRFRDIGYNMYYYIHTMKRDEEMIYFHRMVICDYRKCKKCQDNLDRDTSDGKWWCLL